MRRAVLLVLMVPLLLAPGRGTLAAWTDPEPPSTTGTLLEAVTLAAPTLACADTSLTSVTISWQAQTTPTTLDYTASVAGVPLTVTSTGGTQRQVVVTGTLLSSLLGGTKTVSVTGSLPGTTWTSTTSVQNVLFVVIGLLVSCA